MAKRLYEFICTGEEAHLFEKLTDAETRIVACPLCEEPSNRIVSTPRISLEGYTGSFPGAAISWERKRAEKLSQERKSNS